MPLWLRIIPFFLSALLFLSAFFSIFSPLPLLILRFQSGRRWMWLAFVTNAAIVAVAGGWGSLVAFIVFVVSVSAVLSEALLRLRSMEKAAFASFIGILATGFAVLVAFSLMKHAQPWAELHHQTSHLIDLTVEAMQANSGGSTNAIFGGLSVEEFKEKLLLELPAAISVFSLVLIVLNMILLLRVNPRGVATELGLTPSRLRYWRAPEFLVWPTLATGLCLVVDFGQVSEVAQSVFKFLMAIYAIQGLSILSFFFDLWQIRGFFRTLGFIMAIFLMMPLLLSLGFFDLWFDFRSKFRHS